MPWGHAGCNKGKIGCAGVCFDIVENRIFVVMGVAIKLTGDGILKSKVLCQLEN